MRLFFIVFILQVANNVFAQGTVLPLQPGNKWVYEEILQDGTFWELTNYEVTDSFKTFNGNQYNIIVSRNRVGESFYKSFSYARKNENGQFLLPSAFPGVPGSEVGDYEFIYYDPNAKLEDEWLYNDTSSVVTVRIYVRNMGIINIFGERVTVSVFDHDFGLTGFTSTYCEKFGAVSGYVFNSGSNIYLKGCYINGVLYGDTTSVLLGVNDRSEKSKTIHLFQNYPNPFNPSTVIPFQLAKAGFVSVKVYDVSGREIRTLFEGQKEPGNHKLTFNSENLSSGVYLVRLESGGVSENRKIVLLK